MTKGELHRLMGLVDPKTIAGEVSEKLNLLLTLFTVAVPREEIEQPQP